MKNGLTGAYFKLLTRLGSIDYPEPEYTGLKRFLWNIGALLISLVGSFLVVIVFFGTFIVAVPLLVILDAVFEGVFE